MVRNAIEKKQGVDGGVFKAQGGGSARNVDVNEAPPNKVTT